MMRSPHIGPLEIRRGRNGGVRFRGTFPYGTLATLSDGGRNGGRPRKETFAPRAFGFAVNDPDRDIHFLSGHRFDRPLASRHAGTLTLTDSDDALGMEADLTADIQNTTWGQDFMNAHRAGLVVGISPGFRLPPQETVPNAEAVTEEDPAQGRALIRTIFSAILFELSAVTKPAYTEALIEEEEERSWDVTPPVVGSRNVTPPAYRWR